MHQFWPNLEVYVDEHLYQPKVMSCCVSNLPKNMQLMQRFHTYLTIGQFPSTKELLAQMVRSKVTSYYFYRKPLCNGNGQSAVVADEDSATPSGSLTPIRDNDADVATPSINETPLSMRRDTSPMVKAMPISAADIEARVTSHLSANRCSNPRFQDQVTN